MAESQKLQSPGAPDARGRLLKAAPVIIVGSVMFSFISYWRAAAIVLCDLASTAFYIGGIVEQAIGPAAPWLIGAVLLFSYAVRALYIESCSIFVRGGVYRVVKAALGGMPAKAAVSALLFDYILTGPISSVSAGQYLMGLILESLALLNPAWGIDDLGSRALVRRAGSVIIAISITLYFFRKNLIGIHESSEKALRIMYFMTAVGVVTLVWCGVTLAMRGPMNSVPARPDLTPKVLYEVVKGPDRMTGEVREMWKRDPHTGELIPRRDEQGHTIPRMNTVTGRQEDPLGFLPEIFPGLATKLRQPAGLLTWIGVIGLIVAFGHAILAMSGEETMAQVYREIESPKLKNFEKAAFVIFAYSFTLTVGVSFLAVLLIPDEIRMKDYADNLLGGLAMHVVGPPIARLVLNAFVVAAGFLILAGAVNTSIIGSNGVLNRVAEDGVLPDQLQKPHHRYGTTYRVLYLIVGLQILTIIASGGNMIILGEAYAFGVIWSFLFNAISMLILRFKDKNPREFKVPLNLHAGSVEIPIGLGLITLVLALTAVGNLLTKEVATIGGMTFTVIILTIFFVTEKITQQSREGVAFEHLEQFTETSSLEVSPAALALIKPYRKLVAVRSPENLYMLRKSLEETDPDTTDVVVMTAKLTLPGGAIPGDKAELDRFGRRLMTAVIDVGEKLGKPIKPLVVPTNNPLFAIINTARSLHVQELVVGTSNKYTAEEQLDQMAFYWINLHDGHAAPLTIRLLSETSDLHSDIGGGCRIPTISERKARSVSDLREAGVGVQHVLMVHDASSQSSDIFQTVITMLDPEVSLALLHIPNPEESDEASLVAGTGVALDRARARKLGRDVEVFKLSGEPGPEIVRLTREHNFDLVILYSSHDVIADEEHVPQWAHYVRAHSPCAVCIMSLPAIPREVEQTGREAPQPE